jgi:hypothetical protein
LTPINGKPTNTTLQVLRRAFCAIHPWRRQSWPSRVPFFFPLPLTLPASASPSSSLSILGRLPRLPVQPSAAIVVAIQNYNVALTDVTLYNSLSSTLTAQILTAVDTFFHSTLEDPDFGFGKVAPLAMLTHPWAKYGTMTPVEHEHNRSALLELWNVDSPIDNVWVPFLAIHHKVVKRELIYL